MMPYWEAKNREYYTNTLWVGIGLILISVDMYCHSYNYLLLYITLGEPVWISAGAAAATAS